jgi:hypothetical protein
VDNSPDIRSYLRFDVQGLSSGVSSATLRLFVQSGTTPYDVSSVNNNAWGETTITYNNAPAVGALINASGAISSGDWIEVDVTSTIAGNGPTEGHLNRLKFLKWQMCGRASFNLLRLRVLLVT